MATEIIYIKGKAKWARLVNPDQWSNFSIQVHPDAEGLEKIRELQSQGLKNTLKKDDDGWYVRLRRPTSKLIKGKVTSFLPPLVVDKDGQPLDGKKVGRNDQRMEVGLKMTLCF